MFLIDHHSGRSGHFEKPANLDSPKSAPCPFRDSDSKICCCCELRNSRVACGNGGEICDILSLRILRSEWRSRAFDHHQANSHFFDNCYARAQFLLGIRKNSNSSFVRFYFADKKVSASEFHDAVMKVWYWTIMWRLSEKGWKKLINLIGFDILTLAHR